jgi:peptidoglycan hydrolase-like protein with peptidoglycan-binding domain
MVDKIFYNESSAKSLGWEPSWLGAKAFDDSLIRKIRAFQRDNGLKPDGLLGPGTFRRLVAHREAQEDYDKAHVEIQPGEKVILYKGKKFPIKWDKVVLPTDDGGMQHDNGYQHMKRKRKVSMFVAHWDVCLNSKSCFRVLNKTSRSASIHFAIDNDGTIYQFLDMNHIAWHASKRSVNKKSVGVEISNAYYPKYQNWYKKNGFGERPMITDATVHGKKMEPFMDFYDIQKEALKALMEAVHNALDIPLETPEGDTVVREVASGKYKGFVHHFNVVKNKIDCAGLDLGKIVEDIKNGK